MYILLIVIEVILVISLAVLIYKLWKDAQRINYIYYSIDMLIDAVHNYALDCIEKERDHLVSYDDIMDLDEAMDKKISTWKDLMDIGKLELLKPYLPENPEKYIQNMMTKGNAEWIFSI